MVKLGTKVWVRSDEHFGWASAHIWNERFENVMRPEFENSDECDEAIINNHNRVVDKNDLVYFLGDVVANCKKLSLIGEMNGNKILVAGNHDAKISNLELLKYFQKVIGCTYIYTPQQKFMLSHIPPHPSQIFDMISLHGHLHRKILDDSRYINICMEPNFYMPTLLIDEDGSIPLLEGI